MVYFFIIAAWVLACVAGFFGGKNYGYHKGRDDGYLFGKDDGFKAGQTDGYKTGYDDGFKAGNAGGFTEDEKDSIRQVLEVLTFGAKKNED